MARRSKFTWFLTGILTAALVVGSIPTALAALTARNIQIFSGIKIYVDDQQLIPTDINGKQVDVFAYNGTTYLPVRAVSQALGKPVQWDGQTSSVYIGSHEDNKPAIWLEELDYFTGSSFISGQSERDNLGQTRNHVILGQFTNTYLLNGQYTAISGTLFQTYDYRSNTEHDWSVRIWGDGELLYKGTVSGGIAPVDFNVDLTGVLNLKIAFDGNTYYGADMAALCNVGLWT